MKTLALASRNGKEIVREPLNLAFGIAFPLIIMALLSAIQANIPTSIFKIESLAPGIAVFGLSFITLFSGMLMAKDRETSFLMRLFASPIASRSFIIGYVLPLLPMAIFQSGICFVGAFFLGLPISINVVVALVVLTPTILLFIGIGVLAGSTLTDKQVGGICGALLTNLVAWFSGTWFDLNLVGGVFERIAYGLPFVHAVEATKAALVGDLRGIFPHLWWVIGYTIIILILAVVCFNKKMQGSKN
ncbi:MAG: ABC transporter permease [Cellulosilyticaceae bacterium]